MHSKPGDRQTQDIVHICNITHSLPPSHSFLPSSHSLLPSSHSLLHLHTHSNHHTHSSQHHTHSSLITLTPPTITLTQCLNCNHSCHRELGCLGWSCREHKTRKVSRCSNIRLHTLTCNSRTPRATLQTEHDNSSAHEFTSKSLRPSVWSRTCTGRQCCSGCWGRRTSAGWSTRWGGWSRRSSRGYPRCNHRGRCSGNRTAYGRRHKEMQSTHRSGGYPRQAYLSACVWISSTCSRYFDSASPHPSGCCSLASCEGTCRPKRGHRGRGPTAIAQNAY